jgi:hypothetical protein
MAINLVSHTDILELCMGSPLALYDDTFPDRVREAAFA